MSEATHPAMTVREVAEYLNVNEKTVYRLAQKGGLPGFKVAGAWRFQQGDLDRWITAQKRAAGREHALPPKANRKIQGRSPKGSSAPTGVAR